MEIKTVRQGEFKEVDFLIIQVGLDRYRINTKSNKLIINKISDGSTDDIRILPVTSNEIEIF